jgi:hypothetical protein
MKWKSSISSVKQKVYFLIFLDDFQSANDLNIKKTIKFMVKIAVEIKCIMTFSLKYLP